MKGGYRLVGDVPGGSRPRRPPDAAAARRCSPPRWRHPRRKSSGSACCACGEVSPVVFGYRVHMMPGQTSLYRPGPTDVKRVGPLWRFGVERSSFDYDGATLYEDLRGKQ